jgi:hypothetical protein
MVAPVAHLFFNPLTTVRISESVGMSLEILKYGKLYGSPPPMGDLSPQT